MLHRGGKKLPEFICSYTKRYRRASQRGNNEFQYIAALQLCLSGKISLFSSFGVKIFDKCIFIGKYINFF